MRVVEKFRITKKNLESEKIQNYLNYKQLTVLTFSNNCWLVRRGCDFKIYYLKQNGMFLVNEYGFEIYYDHSKGYYF